MECAVNSLYSPTKETIAAGIEIRSVQVGTSGPPEIQAISTLTAPLTSAQMPAIRYRSYSDVSLIRMKPYTKEQIALNI